MSATVAASNPSQALSTYLATKQLHPTQAWLQSFLSTARLTGPLQGLQMTALFRLLATDITTTLQATASSTLPLNATNVEIREQKLQGPIPVQVLDIEDIGRSRWSQAETLEQQERGEMTKGRELIRLAPDSEQDNESTTTTQAPQPASKSIGPHKVLLQDAKGAKIYGFEIVTVDGIDVNMSIGAKILLRNVVVARGVVLLEPQCVEVLGGKVDAWDKEWRKGRKDALKAKAQST